MKKILLLAISVGMCFFSYSQYKSVNINDFEAYVEVNIFEKNSIEFLKTVNRARRFVINQSIKESANIQKNDTLVLDLFQDKKYKALIDNVETDIHGTLAIRSKLLEFEMAYCIITVTNEGIDFMRVNIPEIQEQYITRRHSIENVTYLLKLDIEHLDIIEEAPSLYPPSDNNVIKNNKNNTTKDKNKEGYNSVPMYDFELKNGIADTAQIDVMILYTPAAASWANSNDGSILNTIANAMTTSQLVLDNSNTNIKLNFVHSAQVAYTEASDVMDDIFRLTFHQNFDPWGYEGGPPWYLDEVHDWRDEFGADLVVLLVVTNQVGGLGWQLTNEDGSSNFGFSLTRVQQASNSYTFIHEIGHNMGAHHHKEQNVQPGPGLFSYSAGWRWTGPSNTRFCSVMTYEHGQYFADGKTHTRVPYFSAPEIIYLGVSTGHATDGDNAFTLRQTKHIVSAYRTSKTASFNELSVSELTSASVTVTTNVILESGPEITSRGFVWDTVMHPDIHNNIGITTEGSGVGQYSSSLTELSSNTTYYIRAYAINNSGVAYSEQVSFTTIPDLTLEFGEGFTWFSINMNPGSMNPNTVFSELSPCADDRVIGQTQFSTYTGEIWLGSLASIEANKMYKMKLCNNQQITLSGSPVSNEPISLNSGFTWLGYLPQHCLPINTAMSGLQPTPSIDDRIIGQNSFAVYTGTQWLGSLTQLCPGSGYIIKLSQNHILTYTSNNFVCGDDFTDSRDGTIYPSVHIGDQCWLAKNLAYLPNVSVPAEGSLTEPYYYVYGFNGTDVNQAKSTANYSNYGVLYNWSAAGIACPQGWRLPADNDWDELRSYVISQGYISTVAGNTLKSCRQVNSPLGGNCNTSEHPRWSAHGTHHGNNIFAFSSLPGGYRITNGNFDNRTYDGYWWTSTEHSSTNAWRWGMGYSHGQVARANQSKASGFSVRCIKN
jgi:uncharacterized protein (TIGR02145 family)